MPWGLKRFHQSGQSHFVTFCCYHRRRLFITDATCRIFESALERVRCSYRLYIYGYVIMPEQVHLLLSEPQRNDTLLNSTECGPLHEGGPLKPDVGLSEDAGGPLKPDVGLSGSVHQIADPDHFWQKRYYDFNIRDYQQFVEKLRYIHRNPVKAGLCERPEDWQWSSFRH